MADTRFFEMEENWKHIIDMGPHPFGSIKIASCAEYIVNEAKTICPDTKFVEFFADGFDVIDWELSLCEPVERTLKSYLFIGSGASKGFHGHLRYTGIHRVWDMYNWNRFSVSAENGQILAYISIRQGGEAIPQSLMEGNIPLPHFIVGQDEENALYKAVEDRLLVKGFANTSVLSQARGRNIVMPLHKGKTRMVLCAHYDTVYNTPGAYDNSSGVAVLMEVARQLSNAHFLKGLDIVFMDGEEFNLLGSKYLANTQSEGVDVVFNVDGVGRGTLLEIWSGPESLERRLYTYLDHHQEVASVRYINPPPPGSDHAPYYSLGIPAFMLTFNDQKVIHSPEDVYSVDKLKNMATMVRLVKGLLVHLGVVSD
jgi:hypothetical protein